MVTLLLFSNTTVWVLRGVDATCCRRPKSIVSVLRRGDAFGDQAIINGQPHGSAASPATNVTLLVISRQVRACAISSFRRRRRVVQTRPCTRSTLAVSLFEQH